MSARWRKTAPGVWRKRLGPVTVEVERFVGIGDRAAYNGRASWRFGVADRRGVLSELGRSGPRLDDLIESPAAARAACEYAARAFGESIARAR